MVFRESYYKFYFAYCFTNFTLLTVYVQNERYCITCCHFTYVFSLIRLTESFLVFYLAGVGLIFNRGLERFQKRSAWQERDGEKIAVGYVCVCVCVRVCVCVCGAGGRVTLKETMLLHKIKKVAQPKPLTWLLSHSVNSLLLFKVSHVRGRNRWCEDHMVPPASQQARRAAIQLIC